ncbi:MAG TPA: glycosyltransferase family 2 protein [Candidatus Paceibacterota bacterium]
MKLSIVIPVYNEEKNIPILAGELNEFCTTTSSSEVIFVDDGSKDASLPALEVALRGNKNFRILSFQKNCGQTAAIAAGIAFAEGDIIVMMDSDLQNSPKDIPRLLEKMNEGYDVVSGWRKDRWKKELFRRKLPSRMANALISLVTGVKLHDYGCTLKAYKKEYLKPVKLYGEMHRFIPAYAAWQGGRVGEIAVSDRPRVHGVSKYGMSRIGRVLLDLLVIKFLFKYQDRPSHFFGGFGFLSFFISGVCALLAIYYKLAGLKDFISTPLPIFTALFFIVGINFILMGILAEFFIRVSREASGKETYAIGKKINF